ncbi:hypothetical protein P691DRAFT_160762 [Macrolepiota fuliginosa MF-IS2]|uniref:Uncharacterized protein n=1 Tax=Macrolepiota fuliginosa MF-IS2 TaxID=1400762 RepID=A0A9P5XCH5_9AGAR|nr:hypothetical protein P691DRAFT_160762 [Macrolepiota fuliginosa MF-IS2]
MVITDSYHEEYIQRDPLESLACCLSSNLKSNPRSYVRSLFFGGDPRSPSTGENFRKIFAAAPNLRRVHRAIHRFSVHYPKDPADWGVSDDDQWLLPHGNPISWNAITSLADNCGSSIVDIDFCLSKDTNKSPEALCNFSALRHLVWDTVITLQLKNLSAIPRNSWSNLESVTYVATRSKTFINFLTYLDLPKLHTARFLGPARQLNDTNQFFENHGRKLRHLEIGFVEDDIHIFDLCPNLKTLDSPAQDAGPPYADFFTCSHEHPLEKIYIKSNERRTEYVEKNEYLLDLDLSNFKSLRSIRMSQCNGWPTEEREIEGNQWVAWAEQIKIKWGVNLLDHKGTAWKPRLMPYRKPSHQRAARRAAIEASTGNSS